MSSSYEQLRSELDSLTESNGRNAFRVAQIIHQLWNDKQFIKKECDRKPDEAERQLSKYAGRFALGVHDMLYMIDYFPNVKDWESGRLDILRDKAATEVNKKIAAQKARRTTETGTSGGTGGQKPSKPARPDAFEETEDDTYDGWPDANETGASESSDEQQSSRPSKEPSIRNHDKEYGDRIVERDNRRLQRERDDAVERARKLEKELSRANGTITKYQLFVSELQGVLGKRLSLKQIIAQIKSLVASYELL